MRKALFLDRDGVINEEIHHLFKVDDFVFIAEIVEICHFYINHGFIIIVITNQAGIAKGLYSEADFASLTKWMIDEFSKRGITIEKVYHCPHHPEYTGECDCRKPKPGMIFQAQKEFDIDLSQSLLIGDKRSDIEAGLNSGIKYVYYLDDIRERINNLPLPS
jgi:D-glycero-D-manno-heptose 1,7-bisphosphate phosphatase